MNNFVEDSARPNLHIMYFGLHRSAEISEGPNNIFAVILYHDNGKIERVTWTRTHTEAFDLANRWIVQAIVF